MLPIVWRAQARESLGDIIHYIAERDPAAARRIQKRLRRAPEPLSVHPYLYPEGRIAGTREMVVTSNYIVVYQVLTDQIAIVNVLHARKQYP